MSFRLLPKDVKFFDLFTADGENLQVAAARLYEMLRSYDRLDERVAEIQALEKRGDEIDREIDSSGGWLTRWPKQRIIGRRIYWAPIPRAVHAVKLYYVPTAIFFNAVGAPITELSADTDYFDGVFGWETLAVLDAAMKLLSDEKKQSAELQQEWADCWATISAAAANQDMTEPVRVRDRWRGGSEDDDRYRGIDE